MHAAARKALRLHFNRVLQHEAGTIAGSDSLELHDMRVAVRRLRAAVLLFRPYLPKQHAAYLRKDLRRLGRALGPARDCDVMLENLAAYRATLPTDGQAALDPLAQRWQKRRARARKAMLKYLESKRYLVLKRRVGAYLASEPSLETPSASSNGQSAPFSRKGEPRVATETPRLICKRYEKLLRYGPSLHGASIETLHAVRIDCKRLRYAMEFLREALAPQAKATIEEIKRAQDHLGELNDAYVAGVDLRKLLEKWQRSEAEARHPAAAQEALGGYLAFCDERVRTHAHTFPVIWERLTGVEFRQRLQEIVSSSA